MKAKYKLFILLSTLLPVGMTGCSSDDEGNNPGVEVPELALKEQEIKVKIGNDVNVDITEGGGDYKAFSLNQEIAKVELANNKLTIQGLKIGKTSLIVSDNDNCYQRLAVMVYEYDAIKLETQDVEIKYPKGHPKAIAVNILEGHGSYAITCDNEDILEAYLNAGRIILNAKGKEGVTNVTVTDYCGLTAVIKVTTITSEIPYDEAELEVIKANEKLRCQFDGSNSLSYYTVLNEKVGEFNLHGWDYNGMYYLKIYFPGDKEVGVKPNSKLSSKRFVVFDEEPIKFEIIKNDGAKIWAVYSLLKDDKLYFGHFCQNINP